MQGKIDLKVKEEEDLYTKTLENININIEKYKTEVFLRLDGVKQEMEDKLLKHKNKTEAFFKNLKK